MNRRNTILLAVLINAGLLVALLISALVGREESTEMPALAKQEVKEPLFIDEIDLAMRQPAATPQEVLPQVVGPNAASVVAHPLPSLQAPEAALTAAPSSAPQSLTAPTAPVIATPPSAPSPSFKEVVVKKGDSLEKIARQHKSTVEEILRLNELSSSFLRVGQVLKVTPSEKKTSAAKPISAQETTYYTVKVGDSPWTIAQKHHLKVEELLKLNSLNDAKARKLKPGDRLRVK